MASKVGNVLRVIGRRDKTLGSHLYHAATGANDGGKVGAEKRHRMRKALARHRFRASGMTDDIYGSKESGGAFENKHEYED